MRISSYESDPGFAAFQRVLAKGKRPRAFIDGTRVEMCTLADDVEGVVEFIAKDRHGCAIVGQPMREDVIRVTLRGHVRIEA